MLFLGSGQGSFCIFEIAPKYCISDFFVDYEGYFISSKEFLTTIIDVMIISIKFPIPVHFSSLIPRTLMFTLAISYMTSSSLPWLMDLTFLVPMQYCSLQHWTLLPPLVTSTAGHCFALAQPLHSFQRYFSSSTLGHGSSSFSVIFFLPFQTIYGFLRARILKLLAISFSSWPCFLWPLHHDPSVLGGPTRHGS